MSTWRFIAWWLRWQVLRVQRFFDELDVTIWAWRAKVDRWRAAWANRDLWQWQIVPNRSTGKVIMARFDLFYLRGKRYALHKFLNPDDLTFGLHSHPWNFWSIVLWGGYVERYLPDWLAIDALRVEDRAALKAWERERTRGWLSTAWHPATYTHAIVGVLPQGWSFTRRRGHVGACWTLVVTSERTRVWDFPQVGISVD